MIVTVRYGFVKLLHSSRLTISHAPSGAARSCLVVLLVLALSWLSITSATASPIILSRHEPSPLAEHLELLRDPGGKLALGDVLKGENSSRFKPIPGFVNLGYTSDASWTRFSFSRTQDFPHDLFLRLGPSFLDHLTVYVQVGPDPTSIASYREYVLGDHHSVSERPVRHSSFVVPIAPNDETPRTVYIRVQTTSTHNLNGWLYPSAGFIGWSELQGLLNGGYLGIALVIACINLIYALRLRDMLYGYYALYVLTLFSTYLGVEGSLSIFFPAGAHLLSDYMIGIGMGLGFASFALFASRLFETRGKRPFVHAYFRFTFLLGVIACLSVPFNWYGRLAPLLMLNGLFLIPFLTWLGIQLVRRGVPAGSLSLTAFTASNIGGMLVFSRLLGLLPANWLTTYSLQIGTVLSMVLMTLALTERLHIAEKKALAAARDAEQKAVELAGEMTKELVDKQKELEDALAAEREALESQVRFVEMVSHEYRTPLAIIRANLDIMEIKACKAECVLLPNIGKMKRAQGRLVEVLEISLGRERLDDARMTMSREEIHLASFMGRLMDEMGELWGERRLELDLGDMDGVTVTGDRSLLKTAFLNLIDNAFKYSAEGEPVSVAVHAGEGEVVVSIRDLGRGIAPDELDKVFEKYYRGASSSDTRGAGIGLYLVRRIMEQHGGMVWLESPGAGGTVAMVRLPLSHSGEVIG